MRRLPLLLLACLNLPAQAQTTPQSSPAASPPAAAAGTGEKDLKRPSGTWPTPPAVMFRESQRTVFAIQLQDYCNDKTISEDFLRQQFAKLSRSTGREENCQTVRSEMPR